MKVISRGNPINLLLTGIALADCLVMLEYIPFTTHMYLLNKRNREEQVSKVVCVRITEKITCSNS